jgi:hypothetical protein
MRTGVVNIEIERIVRGNPVIALLSFMESGEEFEVVDMPKCEKKWFYNENGEYTKYED